FASVYSEKVKFDHKQERWLIWRPKLCRWVEDKQDKVRQLMKFTARRRLRAASKFPAGEERDKQVKWALGSENRYRIDAALELAKSKSPISDDGEKWDADPWLLGVANGVIDLRTGRLRQARPEDRITLYSPVAFNAAAKCPRF